MLLQYETGIAHHHENKVEAHGPESANHDNAVNAFRLQDAVPEARTRGSRGETGRSNRNGFRPRSDALVRRNSDIDMSDVEGRGCKAGCVIDGFPTGSWRLAARSIAVVMGDDEEPRDGECRRIGGVDDRVEDVEDGESEAVERRLGANVWGQDGGQNKSKQRVDVHG